MTSAVRDASAERLIALFNYIYLLAMMAVIAAILSMAMILQYANGELPCPLCLLERLAMFGVCFGIIMNFRNGFSYRNTGISLLFSILLLVFSVRQTLLDIYPRPGHAYIGSAVFGLHMPVWSIVIALCLLSAYAIKLALIGDDEHLRETPVSAFPLVAKAATVLSIFVIALCAINVVSVVIQCGLSECHTFGYKLLGGK
jgi:disulfide bond formation protein DsbB